MPMSDAWAFAGESVALAGGVVTLVEGANFCVSDQQGEVEPGAPHGLFVLDTRIVSTWEVRLDGLPLLPLGAFVSEPFHATFLSRAEPVAGRADSTIVVRRDRYVGVGMREDIELRNMGREAVRCHLTVRVDADFADLFAVKEGRAVSGDALPAEVDGDVIGFTHRGPVHSRGVRIAARGAEIAGRTIVLSAPIPAHGVWSGTLVVTAVVDGRELPAPFPFGGATAEAEPARRLSAWEEASPAVVADDRSLMATLEQSQRDIGALRIFSPEHPTEVVVAAGAPWFMTLFGRDSILTSYMTLPVDPTLALGTLHALARHQGTKSDPTTEEEPGRILHEMRFSVDAVDDLGGANAYYGTVDATPLFVLLLGELRRWGIAQEEVDRLLPHADRALEWVVTCGDRDGDGFVEYQQAHGRGLANQGWKDSWDGINFADGSLPKPPIALCEVQGYAYAAYLARAYFAQEAGDMDGWAHWRRKASELRQAFNERFWLPDRGWFAVGLDGDKRPIDALASNMGHCLWTGIVDPDKAAAVADRLLSPEMFSGWGVRTLATSMGAYNPVSYHNGSVWPHDNALIASGLMRYGFVEHAQRVATAIFDTAAAFGGRLPELLCGFDRDEFPAPVPYPASCSPQAWAAASPIHLLRVLLRVDPWIPRGRVWIAPALPPQLGRLRLTNVPLAGARVSLTVDDGKTEIDGLPDGVVVIHQPRDPLTAVFDKR
jgi:glycogen debranching enzyme